MILGVSTATFTLFHVALSLIGIASGLVVVVGMSGAKRLDGMTALFLATTVATSVTGFLFQSAHFGPPHVIGLISLVVLVIAILARYSYHLVGSWRWIYIVSAVLALYFNVFVGVVQAFQKLALLQPLVLAAFALLALLGLKRFYPVRDPGTVSMKIC